MLRIAEQWYGSDVGRQRQGNEDSLFVRAPIFVVADGMGGAQAGEVASRMAVDEFEPGLPDGAPELSLVEVIRSANRRIHELSRSDAQRQGMGTTCTAVYVGESEVVLAHVGDSRCYLLRRGELTRLTRDHSLVGELVDRGKLTEEQAETHPQRSVITRALGPEADVRVDTERIAATDGDLFLLCSDGLTSMIREAAILPILTESPTLEEAGRRLIAAANEAGGRDNITVVLFRIEHVGAGAVAADEQATSEAAAVGEDDAPEAAASQGASSRASDAQEADYRRSATVAVAPVATDPGAERADGPPETGHGPPPPSPTPAVEGRPAAPPRERAEPGSRRDRRRTARRLAVVLVVLAIVLGSAWLATRAVFFVGLDDARAVTVFRGLPYELPGGIDLYTTHYRSGVTIDQVPPARRATFTEHKLRSLDDARDLVRQLELGKLER